MSATPFFTTGDGIAIVPNVFTPRELKSHAQRVYDYVLRGGPRLTRGGLLGSAAGGWYVASWAEDPLLAPLGQALHGSSALHAALRRTFGGNGEYQGPLGRTEMLIDRRSDWHVDKVHGEFTAFFGRGRNPMWKAASDGSRHRIVTVAVYLQDHADANDTRALTYRPGGHVGCEPLAARDDGTPRLATAAYAGERIGCSPHKKGTAQQLRPLGYPVRTAHPRLGDVVIFDTRLPHRGQREQNARRQLPDAPQASLRQLQSEQPQHGPQHQQGMRIVATLTYGATANAFTAAYDRAFRWRAAFFNDAALRNATSPAMRKAHIRAELRARGVPAALDTLAVVPRAAELPADELRPTQHEASAYTATSAAASGSIPAAAAGGVAEPPNPSFHGRVLVEQHPARTTAGQSRRAAHGYARRKKSALGAAAANDDPQLEARLATVRGLFADPVRLTGDPPFVSPSVARRAAPFWRECPKAGSHASRIPNEVHQPWLHGTTPKWEHILGMLSVRFVLAPSGYTLYYDRRPANSPQWACACSLARCVHRRSATQVPLRPARRVKMGHWPEIMRYDLLLEHGGIFLDHDAYVLRPLDGVRRCCAGGAGIDFGLDAPPRMLEGGAGDGEDAAGGADSADSAGGEAGSMVAHDGGVSAGAVGSGCMHGPAGVIGGFEQEEGGRKLNPGALLAEPGSEFLRLWRASWFNYSSRDWDYNCCQVSYRLHAKLGGQLRSHLRADLGPMPRYATEAEYDAHLRQARVVHVTALSQPWRRRDSRRFGIMEKVSRLVLRRANTSWHRMDAIQQQCVQLVASQMERKHARTQQAQR